MNKIDMIFTYDGKKMILPTNPSHIEVPYSSSSETADVLGIGQVSIQQGIELATIDIESLFWQEMLQDGMTTKDYITWIKDWQKSSLPARFVVVGYYDLYVTCEEFIPDVRHGEEYDAYYSLRLLEYRPYGAKRLVERKNNSGMAKSVESKPRTDTKAPPKTTNYVVKKGDCLWNITKMYGKTGSDWKELYAIPENKVVIGNNPNLIYPGQTLIIPESWIKQ